MSIANSIEYSERVKPVTKIRLGILSPERIIKQSVAEIYKPVSQNEPLDGTLMDPRLGTNSKQDYNKISDLDYNHDPGNFGHLRLAKPVVQIKFFDMIMQILKLVCYKCSHLLVDKEDQYLMDLLRSKKGKHRFKVLKDYRKLSECPNCGANQPTWTRNKEKNKIYQVSANFAKRGEQVNDQPTNPADDRVPEFTTEVIYHILKAISDEDSLLLGFDSKISRPDWMIWTVMPIPPPQMRPTIRLDNGQTSEDDLTSILNNIISTNVGLYKAMEKSEKRGPAKDPEKERKRKKDVMERWALLQVYVAAYTNNEQSNMDTITNRSSRPLKTLKSRIEAKQGRVRSNLMGKRVDYTARTVITADPNISIDELGVPIQICKTLDYREVVTHANLTVLHNLVQKGPHVYPGANAIERRNASGKKVKINLEYGDRSKIRLKPGDIVYRHLMDDDWVKFNRQPSLHKMSMMAHRVKALPHDTFRLNVSVTTPYNADFDGDKFILSQKANCQMYL